MEMPGTGNCGISPALPAPDTPTPQPISLAVPVVTYHKVTGQANWGRSTETLARIGQAMQCQCVALDCYPYTAGSTMLHTDPTRLQGRVLIAHSDAHPGTAGRDLEDIAREWGVDKLEAARRLQPASTPCWSTARQCGRKEARPARGRGRYWRVRHGGTRGSTEETRIPVSRPGADDKAIGNFPIFRFPGR
jgi:hypothetical protein